MNLRYQIRRDTAANWTSANPVLRAGELGLETDTYKLKAGDGTSAWSALGYLGGGTGAAAWGSITGTLSSQTDLQTELDAKASLAGAAFTGAITTTSTVDGRDVSVDGTKLDTLQAVTVGATAPSSPATGQFWYDTDYLALRVYDGTEWRIAGDHVLIPVHNNTGSTINRTRAVYVSGSNGSGVATVALARADSASTMPAIGLADQDIADGDDGFVLASGMFEDVNTSSFTSGDALYVSPTTAGAFTTTRPTDPAHLVQKVALITHANTNGAGIVMGAGRANDVNNEITALTGVGLGDEDLGTFTGTTIPDNQTIKQALQSLETASEDALLLDGTRSMTGSLDLGGNGLINGTVSGSLLGIGTVPLNRITGIADNTLLGNNSGLNGPPVALTAAEVRSELNVEDGATNTNDPLADASQTMTGSRIIDDGDNGYFFFVDLNAGGGDTVQFLLNPAIPSATWKAQSAGTESVTLLNTGTRLNLLFAGSADLAVNSNPGTAGQVLTSNGSGSAPSWSTQEYMTTIWAEENAPLGNGLYEWAFGNGGNTPSGSGVPIYVPSGWSCEVVAMGLVLRTGTATVELDISGTAQGTSANVTVSSGTKAVNTLSSPVAIVSGDTITFRTTSHSGTTGPCVVSAWLRYYK